MNAMTPNTLPIFLPLTGLYEPSAIQQLADGRFLIVEDEKEHSFSLVTLSASGVAKSEALGPGWFEGGDAVWNLDDLEGYGGFKLADNGLFMKKAQPLLFRPACIDAGGETIRVV